MNIPLHEVHPLFWATLLAFVAACAFLYAGNDDPTKKWSAPADIGLSTAVVGLGIGISIAMCAVRPGNMLYFVIACTLPPTLALGCIWRGMRYGLYKKQNINQ